MRDTFHCSASIFFPFFIGCTEVIAVGKRVRKKWDLPSEQMAAMAALGALFLLGGVLGCLAAALALGGEADELCAYLADYLTLSTLGELPRELWFVLWGQLKYLLAVFVLGFTAIGVVCLPLLLGVKGFLLSFSVTCFCRVFGSAGLLPAFVLFGLPALLSVPALFLAGVQSFSNAMGLLHRLLGDSGRRELFLGTVDWCRIGLCAGLMIGCGLLEYWVVPVLLQAVAQAVL